MAFQRTIICIPTKNPGPSFPALLRSLEAQELESKVLIIDSGSSDGTPDLARQAQALVHTIPSGEFNHGGTRNLALSLLEAEIYIFMTQDAVPANPYLVKNLVQPLTENQDIGLVYGRQLPRPDANPLEAFNRQFNYPAISQLKRKADRVRLGLKTVFCSNACAAYRFSALAAVGGFPPVIMCEDQYVAAKMLEAGLAIYYAAEAMVYHSHDYSLREEFKRYFDLGVFFGSRERWIVDDFGKTEREGYRLFQEGRRYCARAGKAHLIPSLIMRLLVKLMGYQLGSRERFLPVALKSRLSLHPKFWQH